MPGPLPIERLPQNPTFVLRGGADRPVHQRQWYQLPGRDDGVAECWCYTDALSYGAGDRVEVFASATEPLADLEVRAAVGPGRLMARQKGVALSWADTPENASTDGCGWPAVACFQIGDDWPSGAYWVILRRRGAAEGQVGARHLIVVRPAGRPAPGRLLLITADATWCAYNDWGGSNHYEGIVDPESNRFAPSLSNQRPWARGFLALPGQAPRTLPERPPPLGAPIAYPFMDWAWQAGYSKKYASAGWASYESLFARWAAEEGYAVDMATQQDLHFRPHVLSGYACVVIVGHDEYWSWQMRDAVDDYVAGGGRVARFAGNFLWQIRLAEEGRRQVCHKYLAHEEDPLRDTDERRFLTGCWEDPVIGRPGHGTFGLDGSWGLYAGWGGMAPRGAGGFTLYRPDHWALAGSGLGYGDVLGAEGRVFGYEVDGLDYRIEGGLPFPQAQGDVPDNLEIIALGLARLREGPSESGDDPGFCGDHDAEFVARMRHGTCDPAALEQVNRGAGMVVGFTKGRGAVFNAGATEWVAGLLRRDAGVVQVTRNVLNRFLGETVP